MEKKDMSEVLLFNDDCVNVLKNLQSESVDLCLTDLPYGILTNKKEADYQNENRNFCDWDFEINYDEVLPQLKRVMKKDGNILLFAKSPFTFKLYEQMIKHDFTHRYNWIWKKNAIANFASMKYRPGNNYEEVMVFTPTPKRGKYFAHAEYNGEVKTKCKFYNYETRTPIPTEEVFDKYLIPYILGNVFNEDIRFTSGNGNKNFTSNAGVNSKKLQEILKEDIRIPNMGACGNKMFSANSTASMAGIKLQEIINEDIVIYPNTQRGETLSNNVGVPIIHLDQILNKDVRVCTHIHGGETFSDNMNVPRIQLDQIFKEKYQGQFEIDLENKILYRTVKSYKNFPTSIIDIKYGNSINKKWKKHPTTKPVEVLEYLIQHYTEEGDTVLDFTMGSGSTGVASKKKKRNFIGCQIGKMWYEVAQARLNDVEEE